MANKLTVSYNGTNIIDALDVSGDVDITYNGQTLATLSDGTKTLKCNGKVMRSDLVIGGKTLKCNGKIMKSDIGVTVEGGSVMPDIGDIITLNGETRRYRVIGKVGNNYKLLDMDKTGASRFNNSSVRTTFSNGARGQQYQGSTLDTAMTAYYNGLSTEIKNAIVDTNINQNMYMYYDQPNTKGDTTYTYQYQNNWSDTWRNANYKGYVNVGNRKCFALDLPDIYEYMAVKGADGNRLASSSDLMKMFFGGNGGKGEYSDKVVWLRSAFAGDNDYAWLVSSNTGVLAYSTYLTDFVVRPAFVIDLSKIEWS